MEGGGKKIKGGITEIPLKASIISSLSLDRFPEQPILSYQRRVK